MSDATQTPKKDRHKNRGGQNREELTGRKFGRLTVLSDTGRRKSRRPIWLCKCECGESVEVLSKYLLAGDTRSCGCLKKEPSHNNATVGVVTGSYFYHVRNNAERRGVPFEITPEEASAQWYEQDGRCAFTGVELVIVQNFRDHRGRQTASLDRIDNGRGYTADNIQWVHKDINMMRGRLDPESFVEWCRRVVEYEG
jgi:hypothetical protein